MDNLQDIVDNMSHVGMINEWKESHLNEYIITSLQSGSNSPNNRIGRIVQVRTQGSESTGSSLVLLRHLDGDLTSHYNQCYIPLKGTDRERVKKAFEDANVKLDDPINNAYSVLNKDSVKGFIVSDEDIEAYRLIEKRNEKIEELTND